MERELWSELSAAISDVARSHGRPSNCTYNTAVVVRMSLWAVLHDRPASWACRPDAWTSHNRPDTLPSQSTLSRRTRAPSYLNFMDTLSRRLRGHAKGLGLLKSIDGKALPIPKHTTDPDAKRGRGTGCFQTGYKLHLIHGDRPMPEAFIVHPLNVDERPTAVDLIPQLHGTGYLLADANFDARRVFTAAHEHDHQLLAPRQSSRQHVPPDPKSRDIPRRQRSIDLLEPGLAKPCHFGRQLFHQRGTIERFFSHANGFAQGGLYLPPFVRRLHRVRLWIHAKLLINAARIRIRQRNTDA